MDSRKIRVYGATRIRVRPKTGQLRMVSITPSLPAQYRPCQQRFAPQRDQALRIKVLRMDCPESHIFQGRLTMKFGDAGMRQPKTKALYPNHRSAPWLIEPRPAITQADS
jgi:hypothetical protein